MKKLGKLLAVLGFNLLLFFVLLEGVGLIDYFAKTREVYYVSDSRHELLPEFHRFERQVESHRIHPYFGFALLPSPVSEEERAQQGLELNNYGFGTPYNYPYTPKSDRELIVGFFGGSVAAKLENFEREHDLLVGSLAAAFDRSPTEITTLNFAQGGFKQPQQLLIYNYFRALGQRIDVVLNIDGFNEIALTDVNVRTGVAVDMPSMAHLSALRQLAGGFSPDQSDHGYLAAMLKVRESYQQYTEMYERLSSDTAWELKTAAGFFIARKVNKLYRKRFRNALWDFQERGEARGKDSWLYLNPLPPTEDPSDAGLSTSLELWVNASKMLHTAQIENGGVYLHFLQPNQYYPTGRTYSEQEKSVAFDAQSPYAAPIRRGYPKLREEVARLQASGLPIYDLAELFDELEAEAYIDNCCHYTDAGQAALAQAIAEVIDSLPAEP